MFLPMNRFVVTHWPRILNKFVKRHLCYIRAYTVCYKTRMLRYTRKTIIESRKVLRTFPTADFFCSSGHMSTMPTFTPGINV